MPNDINQAWGITFMQKYAPDNYKEYQDILAGNKTFGTVKKDILKRGIQQKDNGPNDQAQNYLNKVLPCLIWRYLMYSVRVNVTDKTTGQQKLEDFDFPLFQYNFPDEQVFQTGNLVDAEYSDNGVEAIPLQMTLNPIYYELQTQLQRSQYFQIVNGEIDIDLGSIENDLNAQGAINIVYNPPGTNMICSWDNLMNQTNANYRLQFGIAESQTQFFWIRISIYN